MFKDKLSFVLKNILNGRLTDNEIKIIYDRVYIEYVRNKQIPFLDTNGELIWIEIFDVVFIKKREGKFIISTMTIKDHLTQIKNISLKEIINKDDYEEFIRCGNNTFVNSLYIKNYDSFLSRVYFLNNESIQVTQRAIQKIRGKLGKGMDIGKFQY